MMIPEWSAFSQTMKDIFKRSASSLVSSLASEGDIPRDCLAYIVYSPLIQSAWGNFYISMSEFPTLLLGARATTKAQ